jgi:hypothetical protein
MPHPQNRHAPEPHCCHCPPAANGETDRAELKLVPFVTPSSSSFVKWLILKGIGDLFPHAERVLFRLYRRSIVRTHACGNRWRSLSAGDSMIETVQ